MTDTLDPTLIHEALDLIDRGLGTMQHRELVSANEVADLLLDVRLLLAASLPRSPEDVATSSPS